MSPGRTLLPKLVVLGLVTTGLGLACTPLGGWLYSDPSFALSGVSSRYRGAPADTLQLILTACNLNDFNVEGLSIEGHLLIDGQPVGSLGSDQSFVMKTRDSVDVTVPLQIPRLGEPPVHAKGDDYLAVKYELTGKVQISTPIGLRVVRLQQRGDVRFDSAGIPSGWTVRNARPCKPGQSSLPGQGVKPHVILDTVFRPQTPIVGQPGQRDGI